jgi:hypothetical protein
MRAAFQPIRKRVPRITEEEAAVLIRRHWMKTDGTLIALNGCHQRLAE